mmetsp:Transcript_5638/g.7836  ORF Transcript_5638/g.7836 Transcript_5638/m.7836 type:complete len:82 (-) Transcript_5638:784-1029(-)
MTEGNGVGIAVGEFVGTVEGERDGDLDDGDCVDGAMGDLDGLTEDKAVGDDTGGEEEALDGIVVVANGIWDGDAVVVGDGR